MMPQTNISRLHLLNQFPARLLQSRAIEWQENDLVLRAALADLSLPQQRQPKDAGDCLHLPAYVGHFVRRYDC